VVDAASLSGRQIVGGVYVGRRRFADDSHAGAKIAGRRIESQGRTGEQLLLAEQDAVDEATILDANIGPHASIGAVDFHCLCRKREGQRQQAH
jgi:hypothetical protein